MDTRSGGTCDAYGGGVTNPYPNPNLAPVTEGPFYAMQVMPGAFGTSGGVRTDDLGRALTAEDTVIAGLFAVTTGRDTLRRLASDPWDSNPASSRDCLRIVATGVAAARMLRRIAG